MITGRTDKPKRKIRILVCGGRYYDDAAAIGRALDLVHQKTGISTLIEGGADGADRLASEWAYAHNVEVEEFPADWDRYGKYAGPMRNTQMLAEGRPDGVVAFPGGKGTADMVLKAKLAGIKVWYPRVGRGSVMRCSWISRKNVRDAPRTLFVFGDNMERRGMGGQAQNMRGEPNAVGIPTKWRPGCEEVDYFTDAVMQDQWVMGAIDHAFERLHNHLAEGYHVMVPSDGLGTGKAELPDRAPRLYIYINTQLEGLSIPNRPCSPLHPGAAPPKA